MRTPSVSLAIVALATVCAFTLPARAEVDFAGGLLVGSGVDTGDSHHNLYQLQLGGFGELVVNDFVLGFRGTRSLSSHPQHPLAVDQGSSSCCFFFSNPDLRSIGADLGYEWDLSILHLSPRLGIGSVRVVGGDLRGLYFDPGAVLDVELGPFMAGADLRYRFVIDKSDWNGFLATARIGLRF